MYDIILKELYQTLLVHHIKVKFGSRGHELRSNWCLKVKCNMYADLAPERLPSSHLLPAPFSVGLSQHISSSNLHAPYTAASTPSHQQVCVVCVCVGVYEWKTSPMGWILNTARYLVSVLPEGKMETKMRWLISAGQPAVCHLDRPASCFSEHVGICLYITHIKHEHKTWILWVKH